MTAPRTRIARALVVSGALAATLAIGGPVTGLARGGHAQSGQAPATTTDVAVPTAPIPSVTVAWDRGSPGPGGGVTDDVVVGDSLGTWQPLTVAELVTVMADVGVPWWIAGGWAVDLHLGRQTRVHEDIDIVALRPDVPAVRRALACWDLHVADPPGTLRPWPAGEALPDRVHDVWCRRTPHDPWQLQLMVDDTDHQDWVYRRDPRVRRDRRTLSGPASEPGRPVLAPEIQLLSKSADPRPKDRADFDLLAPALSSDQAAWLRGALTLASPGHPWLDRLADGRDDPAPPDVVAEASRTVYRNAWMTVREDRTRRRSGEPGIHGVVEKPDFALVVPWDGHRFHLVEQFRYPIGQRRWEFPQGSWPDADRTVDPLDLARAELAEETGLTARSLRPLGHLHTSYGYCTEGFHVILATDLSPGRQRLEATEADLVTAAFTEDELWALVADGRLTDAPTLAALALLARLGSTR